MSCLVSRLTYKLSWDHLISWNLQISLLTLEQNIGALTQEISFCKSSYEIFLISRNILPVNTIHPHFFVLHCHCIVCNSEMKNVCQMIIWTTESSVVTLEKCKKNIETNQLDNKRKMTTFHVSWLLAITITQLVSYQFEQNLYLRNEITISFSINIFLVIWFIICLERERDITNFNKYILFGKLYLRIRIHI